MAKERAVLQQVWKKASQSTSQSASSKVVWANSLKSCLTKQKFVKDDSVTIEELLTNTIAKIGENVKIRRFVKFTLNEGLEKNHHGLAAEVAAAVASN